ncbi:MAG: CotH kinase family protein [Muribaculaceae bacterium]|nr:CotH kinase family protein [Muribaculaceae bacterium]
MNSNQFYLLFVAALLCACSSNDILSPEPEPEPVSEVLAISALSVTDIEAVATDSASWEIDMPYSTDLTSVPVTLTLEGLGAHIVGTDSMDERSVTLDLSRPATITVADTVGAQRSYTLAVYHGNLPMVYIETPAPILSKEEWVKKCSMTIVNAGESNVDLQKVQLKGRGNSTWGFPKKPYAVKLDSKTPLLGMPAHKRWCLLANWNDRTLLRNDVSFEVARHFPALAWTPRGQFVEVTLNGEFMGNYYLCEQIKVAESRVNITEMTSDDTEGEALTGGYLFELDTNYDEVNKFRTPYRRLPVNFKDPDEDVLTPEQFAYASDYFSRIESILYGRAEGDIFDYIDIDSFIDWWLMHELVFNGEPQSPKSSYMYKDRGGLLCAGPVWDFDWGTLRPKDEVDWYIDKAIWYGALLKLPRFRERTKERWAMIRSGLEEIPAYIDAQAALISESAEVNYAQWPMNITPNGDEELSQTEAVERMKSAYISRLAKLDILIEAL